MFSVLLSQFYFVKEDCDFVTSTETVQDDPDRLLSRPA